MKFSVLSAQIVLFILAARSENVSGIMDVESVYEVLTRRLDDIFTEAIILKLKVEDIDKRVKNMEEKLLGVETTTTSTTDIRIVEGSQESENVHDDIKMKTIAVQKMLSKEKMLLRESMENFTTAFSILNSEVRLQMSAFNESFKVEMLKMDTEFDNLKTNVQEAVLAINNTLIYDMHSINASLEAKTEYLTEIVNNNTIALLNAFSEMDFKLNATSLTVNKSLESVEYSIKSDIEKKHEEVEKTLSSMKESLQSYTDRKFNALQSDLTSRVSSLSSTLTSKISSESSALSTKISSESSSLSRRISSEVSSLSSTISSLSRRIETEEERKVAFSVRIVQQSDKEYSANEVIIFDNVRYNEGRGYSSSTGIFTAPKSGTYLFTVSIEGNNEGSAHVFLNVSGTYMCDIWVYKGTGRISACTTITYVDYGDKIWVEASSFYTKHYIENYRSQFSGVLID